MANAGRVWNFYPGPAAIPTAVLEELQRECLSTGGEGMNVMEMSHRGAAFKRILNEATSNLEALLGIPAPSAGGGRGQHHVVFAHGGATMQFSAVPLNLLWSTGAAPVADYAQTGQWSTKAIAECRKFGVANVAVDGVPLRYRDIPPAASWRLTPGAAYFHYCSNETIDGAEFPASPAPPYHKPSAVPLVSDMSSNFCSRPIDRLCDHGVAYAALQKNLGPAGTAVVLLRDDVVKAAGSRPAAAAVRPTLLSYEELVKSGSVYNTPSCWSIYVTGKVLKYLREAGGLQHWDELSKAKSSALYAAIDESEGFYANHTAPAVRSRMNVPFELCGPAAAAAEGGATVADPALEARFLKEAAARRQLVGLEGHRSVGGCRASLYNAMTLEGVHALTDFMKEFRDETVASL